MVRRKPNLGISGWWNPSGAIVAEHWEQRALCRGRHDLPWTGSGPMDRRPDDEYILLMSEVCGMCTERQPCATRALNSPNTGGFFAGVWLPWNAKYDEPGNKTLRQAGRERLTRIANA